MAGVRKERKAGAKRAAAGSRERAIAKRARIGSPVPAP
jgi:hypothetical protein